MELLQSTIEKALAGINASVNWPAMLGAYKGISEAGRGGPQFINAASGDGVPTAAEVMAVVRQNLEAHLGATIVDGWTIPAGPGLTISFSVAVVNVETGAEAITAWLRFTAAQGTASLT